MTWEENRDLILVKSIVYNKVWVGCKIFRSKECMEKAALFVVERVKPKAIEAIEDPHEKKQKQNQWVEENGPLVHQFLMVKRNEVNRRFAEHYIEYFLGWDGTLKNRKHQSEIIKLDVSKPKTLIYPTWLPNREEMLQIALRDPEAWGYDDDLNLVDPGARARMDRKFAYYWDKQMGIILGASKWSIEKRCKNLLSFVVKASNEAFAVWMLENNWERWQIRAMYGIVRPELQIYKKKNGDFVDGLESLKPKYTSTASRAKPFAGITDLGKNRLAELTKQVADKRLIKGNYMRWRLELEERVRKIVHRRNGQDDEEKPNEKQRAKRKGPVVRMATVAAVGEQKMDCDDLDQW